jgi:hypothetical protein
VRTGAPAGFHDDCVIALALAVWFPGKLGPPQRQNLEALLRLVNGHRGAAREMAFRAVGRSPR